ncbi:unnamed protein product [Didymodactylos carnosus]|uniref:Reverse transcriptase RNase H-like domain-containing protein n=1 Tax=Didymodactylos carnosus TaxID=1234261 RepID=A0A8S2DK66_9BILA|nr:unnamed protein product [Didymodactylos carnosus]CAF3691838.1 unnamed protein product [Didymodactylos carnosus]
MRYKFNWGLEQLASLHELKKLLTEAPLFLNFPVDKHPIILATGASLIRFSGFLQQEIHGKMHKLYYHSQLINSTQRRFDTGAKEALVIILSIKRMRQYLLGRDIIMYTDHCAVCGMQNKTLRNTLANRISIMLKEYNIIQIIYIQGGKNCLTDYLSRHPIEFNGPDLIDPDFGFQVKSPPSSSIILQLEGHSL